MSNTPETEAEIRIHTLFSTGEEQYLVRADFARRLERERDEAREALELVMDWAPLPPDYMDEQDKVRWRADFEKARKVLEAGK